jgi:hypothetical protein
MTASDLIHRRLDYEPGYKEALRKNTRSTVSASNLKRASFLKKILSFSSKHGIEPEVVWDKIQDDWMFALWFATDPTKQNMHENVAAEFIRTVLAPIVGDFVQLPKGGPQSLILTSVGAVIPQVDLDRLGGSKENKTVDFTWGLPFKTLGPEPLRFYATHKRTKERGGTQDNQYAGQLAYMEAAKNCRSPDVFHLIICDGPYYLIKSSAGRNKLEDMNRERSMASRWAACTINQVAWHILREASVWANHHRISLPEPLCSLVLDSVTVPIPSP